MPPDSPVTALGHLDVRVTDLLAVRIWRWLVNLRGRLPTGTTLAEPGGDGFDEYVEHADETMDSFAATAEGGVPVRDLAAAAHGGLAVASGGNARVAEAGRDLPGRARRSEPRCA